jgi:Ca2+-binding EF-hand superfamily protein
LNRGRRSARRRHRVFGGRRIVATGLIAKGRDGFIERAEIEAVIHAEFNQYDMDRDNKITVPEVRLIVQRSLQRQAAERQQIEARRRQGMLAINDFIDMQLLEADKLDKNNDGKISEQE